MLVETPLSSVAQSSILWYLHENESPETKESVEELRTVVGITSNEHLPWPKIMKQCTHLRFHLSTLYFTLLLSCPRTFILLSGHVRFPCILLPGIWKRRSVIDHSHVDALAQ